MDLYTHLSVYTSYKLELNALSLKILFLPFSFSLGNVNLFYPTFLRFSLIGVDYFKTIAITYTKRMCALFSWTALCWWRKKAPPPTTTTTTSQIHRVYMHICTCGAYTEEEREPVQLLTLLKFSIHVRCGTLCKRFQNSMVEVVFCIKENINLIHFMSVFIWPVHSDSLPPCVLFPFLVSCFASSSCMLILLCMYALKKRRLLID